MNTENDNFETCLRFSFTSSLSKPLFLIILTRGTNQDFTSDDFKNSIRFKFNIFIKAKPSKSSPT